MEEGGGATSSVSIVNTRGEELRSHTMPGYIHHIEWCVRDGEATERKLVQCFGFR